MKLKIMDKEIKTHFAPAKRSDMKEVFRQSRLLRDNSSFRSITEAMPHIITILNSDRQIIYANEILLNFLGLKDMENILGQRPGEALDCIHSDKMEGGCGTSEFCSTCGAANAIMQGLQGEENAKECRISTIEGTALDFMVWAKPISVNNEEFLAFSITDISDEKRRHALEKIFFHDLINTAGAVKGYTQLLKEVDLSSEKMKEISSNIDEVASILIDEIKAQHQLLAAEKNELIVMTESFSALGLVQDIVSMYSYMEEGGGKNIRVAEDSQDVLIKSDKTLLNRILGNMLKNAVESCCEGGTVTVFLLKNNDKVEFRVHNMEVMNSDVMHQVFQRSFSTKGSDRGLGTYSMKLLSNRYLKGDVTFTSTQDEGTTFIATYPLSI